MSPEAKTCHSRRRSGQTLNEILVIVLAVVLVFTGVVKGIQIGHQYGFLWIVVGGFVGVICGILATVLLVVAVVLFREPYGAWRRWWRPYPFVCDSSVSHEDINKYLRQSQRAILGHIVFTVITLIVASAVWALWNPPWWVYLLILWAGPYGLVGDGVNIWYCKHRIKASQ